MRTLLWVTLLGAALGSPVQKVIEMLGDCKGKVEKDLAEEKTAMQEFTAYCDDGAKDKAYAIETAAGSIEELKATIEDSTAAVTTSDDEIATLGTAISKKEAELDKATAVRKKEHGNFVVAEKELVESVDQLGRAVQVLKKGKSFTQMRGGALSKKSYAAIQALKTIVESQWLSSGSRKHLQSFLQAAENTSEDDELSLEQPQAKQVAYESSSGGIIQTVEDMQGKAEDTLSQLRKKEMEETHAFEMLKGGLEGELNHDKEKLATSTKKKAAATQAAEDASAELVETEKTKAADEAFLSTLKHECQQKAVEFEQSMKEGKDEIAAIMKASEILEEGVTAFVEVSAKVHKYNPNDDDEDEDEDQKRAQLVKIFKGLLRKRHSFVLTQLVSMAGSDPFEKIKGLITEMIDKLVKEAQEAATHEAFCQEEMGKTKEGSG